MSCNWICWSIWFLARLQLAFTSLLSVDECRRCEGWVEKTPLCYPLFPVCPSGTLCQNTVHSIYRAGISSQSITVFPLECHSCVLTEQQMKHVNENNNRNKSVLQSASSDFFLTSNACRPSSGLQDMGTNRPSLCQAASLQTRSAAKVLSIIPKYTHPSLSWRTEVRAS